jgi:gas vesicle protein
MSDTRYGGSAGAPSSRKTSVEQAKELAGDMGKQASEVAQHATARVKEQVSEMTESAKELASDAGDKLRDAVQDQKNAGADFISGVAGAVRRAANEFDDHIPQAGQYIRRAAAQIDGAGEALRRRDLAELLGGVQDFARRQPTAFLGATVLAGFAVVRLLKSSTAPQQTSTASHPGSTGGSMRPEHGVHSPAGMHEHRGYSSGISQNRM